MAFAKMQTPQSLRDTYMLTDADFESIRDSEDTSIEAELDAYEVHWSILKGRSFLSCILDIILTRI